jgi:hypothetical protein
MAIMFRYFIISPVTLLGDTVYGLICYYNLSCS